MMNSRSIAQDSAVAEMALPFEDARRIYTTIVKRWKMKRTDETDSVMLYAYVQANNTYDPAKAKLSTYFWLVLKNELRTYIRSEVRFNSVHELLPKSWDEDIDEWEAETITYDWNGGLEVENFYQQLTEREQEFIYYRLKGFFLTEIAAKMGVSRCRASEFSEHVKYKWMRLTTTPPENPTHCFKGHALTPDNIKSYRNHSPQCKKCNALRQKTYRARLKEQKNATQND